MAITTTLAACSTNPASNGPDGSADLPSSLDDAIRYALSFIAQLRDQSYASPFVGAVAAFSTATAPTGWLKLNGQLVSRTTYANLWAFVQASGLVVAEGTWTANSWGCFSVGDGATTFRLPDMRGMHVRGLDESRGIDTGRVFGQFQDSNILSHAHGVNDLGHSHGGSTDPQGTHNHALNDPGHNHVWGVNNVNAGGAGSGAPTFGASAALTSTNTTGISLSADGLHAHNVTTTPSAANVSIQNSGGSESRVKTIAWPHYIKY